MWKTAFTRMAHVFSPIVLKRGLAFQQKGHVLNLRFSDGLMKARVKGDANGIYNVLFDLRAWPETPSECGCPAHLNCEHAAASLFELQAQENQKLEAVMNDAPHFPLREEVMQADHYEWYSEIETSQHDFFSYQLGILVDGQPVSIVPAVIDLIHRWDVETLKHLSDALILRLDLGEGRFLKIELGRLKPLLYFLFQYVSLKEDAETALKVKRYQLLLMLEAEMAIAAVSARWQGTEVLSQKLKQLTALNGLPAVTLPQGFKTQLRDYQQQGLNWLQGLRQFEFGGVLADDMGLGKTVQTLAHLLVEKEEGRLSRPSLIVAPTSLVGNWLAEARRFTPELNVLVFHGSDRHQDDFEQYDLIVSTYGLLQRDKKRFLAHHFYYLILDEAQFIKNYRAKTTYIVHQLSSSHRLCLTGTPLENHLGELWSLFHFLMPGFLGTVRQFRQQFKNPIEKEEDRERQTMLSKRIQPFMLRRTKSDVLKELPGKTEMIRMVEISGAQRDLYEAVRISMEEKVRRAIAAQGMGKSHIVLLDALLKLRQVCCDPRLLSLSSAVVAHGNSAKLDVLMELLENTMEEGRSVLVFSQFTSMLRLIEQELCRRQYDYLKLTGQTKNRTELVQRFQEGEASVFLISLKAGGTGLNLTRADTVIHYDPWWNPAVETQATDRTHRIGQENPVFVYKLITSGTVEEAILKMQRRKKQLAEGVLSTSASGHLLLSGEEIAEFFKPLG